MKFVTSSTNLQILRRCTILPDAEYERRYALARKAMVREGLDAIIFTGSYNVWSFGAGVSWASGMLEDRAMVQYVILPLKGDPTLVYPHPGCHIEAMRKMVSVKDVRGSRGGHFGLVMADRFEELGLLEGRIGVTACDRTGPEYMGMMTYRELQDRMPKAEFVFLPELLHELTYFKSEEEIAAMVKAGELVVKGLEALVDAAKPGNFEYQLEAAAWHAIMNGGGRPHFMIIGSTSMYDPKMVFPNPHPSQRVLKEGDIILTEMVASYKGYTAKIGQPVTIGAPTEEMDTFYKKVVLPGFKAIEDTLVPGKSLEEARLALGHFRKAGAQSRPVSVHGLDLITAPPYVYTDQIKGASMGLEIKPNTTFAIEITPINKDGTYGMFMSRSYVITEDGHRDITPYPMDEIIVV